MKKIRRLFWMFILFGYCNYTYICAVSPGPGLLWGVLGILGTIFYICYHIVPGRMCGRVKKGLSVRVQALIGGVELVFSATVCSVAQVIFYLCIWKDAGAGLLTLNGLFCGILLLVLLINGMLRIFFSTKQVSIAGKILMAVFWWVPLLNIYFAVKIWRAARFEYEAELHMLEMNSIRRENHICHTKYPVLMVHGIFFRDWQFMNYWGRIPAQLKKNGAEVYYGKQQSAVPVAQSAEEIKQHILQICSDTGCEKVNIIAHSKGGLDARYAISCLGMAPYVASLTTINTPHRGCRWVDEILALFPDSFVQFVAKRYNAVFKRLGDASPDFYESVYDLTQKRCMELNPKMLDQADIYYQSYMSIMRSGRSAGFPLNICFRIIQKKQGENDGLVPTASAPWGDFKGVLKASGRRGISHGDMIDLNRQDIPGFEVREFYIQLVKGLKEKGL
jgi:triacylglycerol lipase